MRCCRPAKVLARARLSRRSAVLALIGIIWITYGVSIYTSKTPGSQFGHLAQPLDAVLMHVWSGALWTTCGFVAVVVSLLPRRVPDGVGFNALLAPALLWTFLYGWSGFMWLVTGHHLGAGRSWVSAVIWSAAVVVVAITAGWPDPPVPDEDGPA